MAEVWLVTVEGCQEAQCPGCARAEQVLRRVAGLADVELPEHTRGSEGEFHLDDGRLVGIHHMGCDDAKGHDLDPAKAPFLIVDGKVIFGEAGWDEERMARSVVDALFPHGLADLRP